MIIGCVVYGFQYGLGVRGLCVSMFDVFWILFELLFSVGVFWPQVSIVFVCARGLVHLVFLQERKRSLNKIVIT